MFGQPSTPFGSPPGGGFGQPAPAPAFGSPAPAPFGAPAPAPGFGGFGTPAPAPAGFGGGFGAPAPAPTGGFGGFGTPAPAPAFGGGGGFGAPAPATSSPFGAPAPAPSGGLFGAPAPAPSGGLFGGAAPAPAPGGFGGASSSGFGGFGSTPSTTPAFGGGSTFGAPAPAPSGGLFGAPAPAPGGFGSTGGFGAPAPSTFGSPAPAPAGGLFGAPAPAPAGGLFGAPAAPAAGGGGTKVQPYQVTNRQDGTSSINLQAITAMPAYENKSFEELRFEDYSQGNRGAGTPSAGGGFGGFGAPAPAPATGGLFGSAPAPAPFGAPAPAPGGFGFGAPAPAPFGAPAPASFGAPAPAAAGFGSPAPAPFGAPAPAPGAFGAPAPGAFGAAKPPASGGLFGAPAPAPGGGLFGAPATPAPGGLFGAPAAAPAFGAPAPAPGGGMFGAPAPAPAGGLFGAPAAAAPAPFGAPAPFAGGFGSPAPAPAGGLFGAPAPAPAFGAPAPGGLFGSPAPAPGGMFGAKPPGTGLFGAPAAPAPFGAPAPAPGAFGQPAAPAMLAAPAVGSVMPPAADEILTAQLTALENKRQEIEKADNFSRRTTESSLVSAVSLSEKDGLSSLTPVRATYPAYRASPQSNAKVRPRGFASPDKTTTPSLSRLGNGGKPMSAPDTMAASSATRLVINPGPKPKLKLALQGPTDQKAITEGEDLAKNAVTPTKIPVPNGTALAIVERSIASPVGTPATPAPAQTPPNSGSATKSPGSGQSKGYDYYQQVIRSPGDEAAGTPTKRYDDAAPILTKPGYVCTPSIEALQNMPAEDLAAVTGFSIERPGVGKIEWEGAVDIREANLDQIVTIEQKSASVYMKEEQENRKPQVGTKLNRTALITLEDIVAPEDTPEAQEKFARKVERQTNKMGAQFVDYDAVTAVWKLRVQHFSRYALDDDESDSEAEPQPTSNSVQFFESGEREGRSRAKEGVIVKARQDTPYKPRFNASLDMEDEEMALVSDVEMADESRVLDEAEKAYAQLETTLKEEGGGRLVPREATEPFPPEVQDRHEHKPRFRYVPTSEDVKAASSMGGICSRIAQKAGVTKCNTDFGMRMGRSFRVGWGPDGSLLCLKGGKVLTRRRPVFSESEPAKDAMKYLEKHQKNSEKVQSSGECPQFALPTNGNLGKAINSYTEAGGESPEGTVSIVKESFSLLKCLMNDRQGTGHGQMVAADQTSSDQRYKEHRKAFAVQQWLVASCSSEVEREIRDAMLTSQPDTALLSAVTGGDMERVSEVAEDLGYHQLAVMLAAGPEARKDILNEVLAWMNSQSSSAIPEELIRAYFMLGGDLKMEEDIYRKKYSPYDWRRRLAMALTYDSAGGELSLASAVQGYEKSLARGVSPYPHPRYLGARSRDEIQSVLYRLLRLGKHELEVPLREIIDPLGHTKCVHDFSLSFHLASAISAMGCSAPLTEVEEQNLLDGYIAQLVTGGHWEWAVYISLCLLSTGASEWKQGRAKDLVLRNFQEGAENRRQFLEDAGVPAKWFEEALALRCYSSGDAYGYLQHMVHVSTDEACASLEQVFIPNMMFMDKENLASARQLLDVFSADESTLVGAVADFFQLYENMVLLEGSSRTMIDSTVPTLLETCENIERVFASYRSGEEKLQGPALRLIPGTRLVPMKSFLAEALSQTSIFKLQLQALKSGRSITSSASQILNYVLPRSIEGAISAREDIVRWLM